MASRIRAGETRSQNGNTVACLECGETFEREGIYRDGVYHCPGRSNAVSGRLRDEPHHDALRHARCWHCGADLGCRRCSGIESELLCRCGAAGTLAAFVAHGPVLNAPRLVARRRGTTAPVFDAYPERWKEAYLRAHRGEMPNERQDLTREFADLRGFFR